MTAKTFRDLRAWQTAYAFKLRIYELIASGPLSNDETLRKQLRESAASAARASLVECQNHLQDAVDRGHITNDVRHEYEKLAKDALLEIGGLLDYLQSPEAKKNAERVRQKRFERRLERNRRTGTENSGTENRS